MYPAFEGLDVEWVSQLESYMIANIKEHTGYTFDEYLQLPLARATQLIKILMDKNIVKNTAEKKALEALQNNLK